ncbi:hypothetical protein O6H91_08G068000 [Diphasiastrum complanatum]|uniref:Uncharacterized protein n=3 Tax=Diphasiastrum complanatum TaxID=34168 RepID=A0ACC2CYI7_DIPCM|nr:hypothetical protein O6H91_08G067900 [Diphasiastrum complanatum]KAJ7547079.1 hypothetical protein O6H91_08G067900 [Diphasiastrum complanatum]KAJ7547080.1 hypothetical protein O6H91_08G068000 [Diphasiastrum complanatum]
MGFKGSPKFEETPPDDFDPEHPYKDPVAMLEMREHLVREKWVRIEMAKILREKVQDCYRREGVNHYQNCRKLVHKYLDFINNAGFWNKDVRPNLPVDP